MSCLRCGSPTDPDGWTELLHLCAGCAPSVEPPAPFATQMAEGKMRKASRWSVFPHEWFYRHDPRYNPQLRVRWRNFAAAVSPPTSLPAWW